MKFPKGITFKNGEADRHELYKRMIDAQNGVKPLPGFGDAKPETPAVTLKPMVGPDGGPYDADLPCYLEGGKIRMRFDPEIIDTHRSPTQLIDRATIRVCLPDRVPARCKYERHGPAYHTFEYEDKPRGYIARASYSSRIEGLYKIRDLAQNMTEDAYREAIRMERDSYFRRASEDDSYRKRRPEMAQTKVETAKALSGRYAICLLDGEKVVAPPGAPTYDTIEEANDVWTRRDTIFEPQCIEHLVVACFNRLDRCWEVPIFNPIYAFHPMRVRIPPGRAALNEARLMLAEGARQEMKRQVDSARNEATA